MLVLTRKLGEAIVIANGEIRVQVVTMSRGRVRLGIEAPDAVAVHREEVWKEIEREAARSGKSTPS